MNLRFLFALLLTTQVAGAATWTEKDSELLISLSNPPDARNLKCPKHWREAWCTFATNYASMYLPRRPRPSKNPTKKIRKAPVPFVVSRTSDLQGESFNKLYDRLLSSRYKKLSTLKPFADAALKTTACPRFMSLALAHRWEVELPSKDAEQQISKLYDHALGCNDYSDIFRVRAGLLEYHFGNKTKALEYLDSALRTEEQREGFRALYWARRIAKEFGKKDLVAKYEDLLFNRFPMSYYTILVKEEKKIDTLAAFAPKVSARPNLSTSDSDQMEYVFTEVLKHPRATQKESKLISYLASKQLHLIDEDRLLKLAQIMDEKGLHRAKILLLNQQLNTSTAGMTLAWLKELYPTPYFEQVKEHAKKAHPFMVMGFMRQESGFDPFIESPAGARGLLQLMPATAKWVNGRKKMQSLYNTDFNIKLGSQYVAKNLERFDGALIKAAAAYNGGFGFVRRWERRYPIKDMQLWADLIPIGETRNYVPSVMVNAYWYQKLYGKMSPDRLPTSVSELFEFTEAAMK
ncbi:MAG TPA: lytic transglycosylase domain-containing protein [Bdellovibrionota bacterium]|nr:lytic transglycosylase domain-containing protein [Bdellovibrionota bacterium]